MFRKIVVVGWHLKHWQGKSILSPLSVLAEASDEIVKASNWFYTFIWDESLEIQVHLRVTFWVRSTEVLR